MNIKNAGGKPRPQAFLFIIIFIYLLKIIVHQLFGKIKVG